MKKFKGIFLIVIIAAALLAAVYLSKQTTFFSPKATTSYQQYQLETNVPVVESTADLDSQINSLDRIDLDQLDQAMNENAIDLNSL